MPDTACAVWLIHDKKSRRHYPSILTKTDHEPLLYHKGEVIMNAIPAYEIQGGFLGLFSMNPCPTTFVDATTLSVRENLDGTLSTKEMPLAPVLLPPAMRLDTRVLRTGDGVRKLVCDNSDFKIGKDWLGRKFYHNTKLAPMPPKPPKWKHKIGKAIAYMIAPKV